MSKKDAFAPNQSILSAIKTRLIDLWNGFSTFFSNLWSKLNPFGSSSKPDAATLEQNTKKEEEIAQPPFSEISGSTHQNLESTPTQEPSLDSPANKELTTPDGPTQDTQNQEVAAALIAYTKASHVLLKEAKDSKERNREILPPKTLTSLDSAISELEKQPLEDKCRSALQECINSIKKLEAGFAAIIAEEDQVIKKIEDLAQYKCFTVRDEVKKELTAFNKILNNISLSPEYLNQATGAFTALKITCKSLEERTQGDIDEANETIHAVTVFNTEITHTPALKNAILEQKNKTLEVENQFTNKDSDIVRDLLKQHEILKGYLNAWPAPQKACEQIRATQICINSAVAALKQNTPAQTVESPVVTTGTQEHSMHLDTEDTADNPTKTDASPRRRSRQD